MNWISPSESLPKIDTDSRILFICDDDIRLGTYEQYHSGRYFVDNISIRYAPDRVQYWMKVPKIPGESDGMDQR